MAQRPRNEEDFETHLAELSAQNDRIRAESESHLQNLTEARSQVDRFKSQVRTYESRCKMAEEDKERQYEESQKRLAMFQEAVEQTNRYKSEAAKKEKVILGLQTDLNTSVDFAQSLQSRISDLKHTFSRVADQMREQNGEKINTARMLADKMMRLRQLDIHLEDDYISRTEANEKGKRAEEEELSLQQRFPPEWQLADENRHNLEERGSPSPPGLFESSLDDELEECDRRRGLDNDSPGSSGGDSDSSTSTSLFSSIRTRDTSTSPTDLSDDATVALPPAKPAKLAWNNLDNVPEDSSFNPGLPEHKQQGHPEFRLDLLEQGGPRKRARIREYQDKTVLREPNPWKVGQKSRLPVALMKDLSRLTLQEKSGKKPTKPSMKQVKSILKQLPGNSQPERFKAPRPDRFKRSKRDKSARDASAVEYTVVVDPAMAENTNMFGTQMPANQSAIASATQPTQTDQCNPKGFHANMFAPEALAPPVTASYTATPNNGDFNGNNGSLIHWGPSATPPEKQPVAKPLQKFKPLGPPIKNSPSLPRIVRNSYRGAIYRPTPYGENSTRLDLPWAAWMTKMHAKKKPAPGPSSQSNWDFDYFQRGAGSMDLLPEQQRVFLKWRIAIMCMGFLFFLWCLAQSAGNVNDRDRWIEVNEVPQSVLGQMRGRPNLNYRWIDIMEYEMLRWSGIDRVALG